MPNFRYQVVNKENQQLDGVIDSPSEDTARQELQDLGFSIVSFEEVTKKEKESQTGLAFEFSGTDNHGKNVSGTIHSEERYQAFRRLITEYELDVKFIVQSNLSKSKKLQQKKEGVIALMKTYQEEVKKLTDMFHKEKIKKIDRNFEKEKALIMRQVDFVLKKVNEAIDKFGPELNPQNKQTIKEYVNKILRLKNTTNLEYLTKTCKSLLEFLQNAEIFTHRKSQIDEKIKLYADTQEMIETLDKGKDFGLYEDLEDQIIRWKSEHIKGKEKIPFMDKMKDTFYSIVLKAIHESEEVRVLKKEVSFLNRELKQYYSIFIKAKDANYRKEASNSIKKLRARKKLMKHRIRVARKKERQRMESEHELSTFESFVDIVSGVSGWLLFFYLIFYFVAAYLTTKQILFDENQIPSFLYLFQTGSIKYMLPIMFLLHTITRMRLIFFKKNIFANVLFIPVFLFASLVVVFNF